MLMFDNKIFRFAQDCSLRYGTSVRAFAIAKFMSKHLRRSRKHNRSPILTASGDGWNASGMHHIDAHRQTNGQWLACVDGTE